MPHSIPQGGHALGDPREVFHALIETDAEAETVEAGGETRSRDWLFSVLSHCTDIMPRKYCEDLGLDPGATYAQGVRHLTS